MVSQGDTQEAPQPVTHVTPNLKPCQITVGQQVNCDLTVVASLTI